MSHYHGRRVTDPKPLVKADIPVAGSGLEGAWDSMTKAKSVLRRAEYRVLEADKPTSYDIGLGPVSDSSVSVDRVPSYTISHTDYNGDKGAILDDYGRTAYMKSKMSSSRKISRLDNKYSEEPDHETRQSSHRSPLRESSQNHPQRKTRHSRDGARSRSTQHRDKKSGSQKYELNLKPVEYTDTASPARVYWSDEPDRFAANSSNVTDMSALRETDVRFINDTQARSHHPKSVGFNTKDSNPAKLTHVDIQMETEGQSSYPRNPRYKKDGVNTTYTLLCKDAKKIKRLKMEDFKKKSDKEGMEKLKERILRQKLNMSSDTGSGSDSSLLKDKQHHDNEAVVPKDYSLYETEKTQVITRKVTSGPAPPHYLGFNEAETRYTVVGDGSQPMKTSELQRFKKQLRKDQEMFEESNMQDLDFLPVKDTTQQGTSRSSRQSRPVKQSQNKLSTTPKKLTRVIARKPTKQEHQPEVITTRSWREGQKLVQKELGKMPKVREEAVGEAANKEIANKNAKHKRDHPPEKLIPESSGKTLSANAKAILEDLQSDKSDSEDEEGRASLDSKPRKRSSPPFKRKRPKSLEPVREEKKIKAPSYDRQGVQNYMKEKQKQAKQMEQKKKEEERIKEEKKKENLQKLYSKQRESAKRSRSKGASSERVPLPVNLDRSKAGSGSDKENVHVSFEDDSGTLTEGSEPPAKIPHSKQSYRQRSPVTTSSKKEDSEIDDLISQYLEKDKVSKEEERKLREQTTQELIQKYLKADAEAKKEQSKPELVAMVTNLTGFRPEEFVNRFAEKVKQAKGTGQVSNKDVVPHVDEQFSSSQGSTKAERLRNLQFMSSSLSTKLRTTAANIASMPIDKWAQPVNEEEEEENEEAEFRTRYDKIIGGNMRGHEVFKGNLPGVGSTYAVERSRTQNQAASRIQAAYRGHSVRQSLSSWHEKEKNKPSDELSVSSHTEDSEAEYRPGVKGLSSRMAKPSYCENDLKSADDNIMEKFLKPSSKPKRAWDEQGQDPYSIFNVYARKQKQIGKNAGYKGGVSSEESMEYSDASDKMESKVKSHRTRSPVSHRTKSPTVHRARSPVSQRSPSPTSMRTVSSYRDDFEPSSHVTKSHATSIHKKDASTAHSTARSYTSVPPRREGEGQEKSEDEDDDTLEAATISHSLGDSPESERKPGDKSSNKMASSRSKGSEDKASDLSDFTYSEDSESAPKDPLLQYSRESATTYPKFGKTGYDVPRMSPAALEHRMMVELGRLEGMEESVRQLTDVERTRGVSLAQQESVSLAQILKAKQDIHMQEMTSLHVKAQQEKTEAAKQLEDAQKRASEAAHSAAKVIHEVRTDTGKSFEENTRKMIESQTNAAKATFEAAKQLAENTAAMHKPRITDSSINRIRRNVATQYDKKMKHMGLPQGPREERATQYSQRSYTQPYTTDISRTDTYISDSFDSQSSYTRTKDKSQRTDSVVATADDSSLRKTNSIKTESVITADDMSKQSKDSIQTESIQTESSRGRTASQTESIPEDVHSERAYSRMDSSLTEEEMDKISRDLVPSEGQRRKLKKNKGTSDIGSFSEDFPTVPSRRLSFEDDSFSRFAADFYEQYVHQEDMRQKHQGMLLTLREKAVNEKLSAEMAWYKQQKQSLRDKGADDRYPQLRKKQRGVIIRLEQEKAEIKKLQEVSRRQQEFLKMQMQDLNKMRQASKQPMRRPLKHSTPSHRISPDSSETEISIQVREKLKKSSKDLHADDTMHGNETLTSPYRDYKSDSEVYSESNGRPPSPSDATVMQKLKKMKQDEKYLTVREQRLLKRRKNVEELLIWQQQLDEEEHEIESMEKKVLALYEEQKKQHKKQSKGRREKSPESKTDSKDTVIETTKYTPRTPRADQTESFVSEIGTETIITERSTRNKSARSITEDINTTGKSFDRSYDKSRDYTAVDSSIQEEDHLKKTHDSSDDTIHDSADYTNETFEDPTTQTSAKKSAATPSPRQSKRVTAGKAHVTADKKATANGRPRYIGRVGSESESDESIHFSETTSDASDIEGKIRVLQEELKRRKLEVEKLKKEHKKNKKEKLKKKEEELKKKIEACDSYIKQVEDEIQHERDQDPATVKPQIKIPSPQTKKTSPGDASKTSPTSTRSESESRPQSPGIKGKIVNLPQDKKSAPVSKTTAATKETSPRGDKSELIESYSEDIISEVITGKSETQDRSEVKLVLDLQEKEDETKKEEGEKQLDTARSVTEIPEENSYTAPISTTYTEKTPRDKSQQSRKKLDSVQSDKTIYSEYSQDYEDSEKSDISQKSDRSYSNTKSSKSSFDYTTESSRTESKYNKSSKKQSVISDQGVIETSAKEPTVGKATTKPTEDVYTDEDISEAIESAIESESIIEDEKDSDEGAIRFDLSAPAPAEEINKSLELSQELVVDEPLKEFAIGDRVLIGGLQPGVLRFKGYTKFGPGYFAGVELDKAEGSNDGSKDGERYFTCSEGYGIFAPADKVSVLPPEPIVEVYQPSQESVENIENISDDILVDDIKTPASPRKEETELDRAIKEAECNLSDFVKEEDEEELSNKDTPTPEPKDTSFLVEKENEKDKTEEISKERTADTLAQNLMNEAIDQIMAIRKNKVARQQELPKSDDKESDEFEEVDIPLPVEDENVTVRPIGDEPPMRPQTPDIPVIPKDDIDKLYDDIATVTGDGEDYWEEFDLMGFKSKPDNEKATSAERKLDIQKLTQETFYAVPNKKEDIDELVDITVDTYWEKRRYGESWDDVEVPSTLFKPEDQGSDLESKSRRSYKRLTFDLVGEIIKDIYKDEDKEEIAVPPWEKPHTTKYKYFKGKKPPTTPDDLKPLVMEHARKILSVDKDSQVDTKKMKVGGRKKKDNVDEILTQELREEEPDWVNYDKDELAVKNQISDSILVSLLFETVTVCASSYENKMARIKSSS